jgi:hypothetical protein
MLFEVFKSTGTEEMAYDDIVMMLQVVAMSLHRLWMATDWDQGKWSHLTESLSDGAYAKVGRLCKLLRHCTLFPTTSNHT